MKNKQPFLALAVFLPALAAFVLPGDKIEFRVANGSSLTRAYTSETHLSLDDMEMTMNGQPLPMEVKMDMKMNMNQKVSVTDTFEDVGAGRPNKLKRTFDELGMQSDFSVESDQIPGGGQDKSITAESELQGKTVVFDWNEEESAFKAGFEGGDGDAALLDGLEEDMDLRLFLPGKEVAVGDKWDLDLKRLRLMLAPGGNLKLKPNEEDTDDQLGGMPGMDNMGDFSQMFSDLVEGTAEAEYKGTREVDGVQCGVIAFKLDISAKADVSDRMGDISKNMPEGMGDLKVDHMDIEVKIEGEGTLYWNLAAGHAHSFELPGKTTMAMDMGFEIAMGDRNMSMEQQMELSGTFTNELKVSER